MSRRSDRGFATVLLRCVPVALLLALLGASAPLAACPLEPAQAAAASATRNIAALAGPTQTRCTATANGARCDMLCVSETRVDQMEAWSGLVVAAAGEAIGRDTPARWVNVTWADRALLERRSYRRLAAARALALQRAVSDRRMTLDAFLARLDVEAPTVAMPRR
jgi:hypothetical protein